MAQATPAARISAQPRPEFCKFDGCESAADLPGCARGYCRKHYARIQKHGDPTVVLIEVNNDPVCITVDCERLHCAKGLCGYHYALARAARQPACSVPRCDTPSRAKGLCQTHYARQRRSGDVRAERPVIGSLPDGQHWCNQCQQVKSSKAFHANAGRAYGVNTFCRDCFSRLCRSRYRPVIYSQQAAWRKANPVATARYGRRYSQANPDKIRAKARRLKAKNPERYRQYMKTADRNRRARERLASGRATTVQQHARWQYFGGLCWMCGGHAHVMDHVKPLARNGSGWPANLRPACNRCNQKKRARWPFPLEVVRAGRRTTRVIRQADRVDRPVPA